MYQLSLLDSDLWNEKMIYLDDELKDCLKDYIVKLDIDTSKYYEISKDFREVYKLPRFTWTRSCY